MTALRNFASTVLSNTHLTVLAAVVHNHPRCSCSLCKGLLSSLLSVTRVSAPRELRQNTATIHHLSWVLRSRRTAGCCWCCPAPSSSILVPDSRSSTSD